MSYMKAEDVRLEKLIREIQQYVDGTYLYIPRKAGSRRAWGQGSQYRLELQQRDRKICFDRNQGLSVPELCEKYHLSEQSIRRILRKK